MTPALLNSTSRRPHRRYGSSIMRATSAAWVTSAATPTPPSSAASLSTAAPSRSASTRRAPPAARRRAVAAPMPRAAPVIRTTRWSRPVMVALLRSAARRAELLGLVALDQGLHAHGIALAVAVAHDRLGPAAGLDDHVREEQVRVDLHGGDVRDVDRLLLGADPARRVLDHAGGRDGDLGREHAVAAGPAAGPEHVAGGERTALAVDHPQQQHRQHDDGDRRVQRPGLQILTVHARLAVPTLPHRMH